MANIPAKELRERSSACIWEIVILMVQGVVEMANIPAKELRERSGSSLWEIANLLEVGRATLRKRLKNCE